MKNTHTKILTIFSMAACFLLMSCSDALPQTQYEKGYNEGYNDGYDEGYDSGYDKGEFYGKDDGYKEGYDDGYSEGYDDGSDSDGYVGDYKISDQDRMVLKRAGEDYANYGYTSGYYDGNNLIRANDYLYDGVLNDFYSDNYYDGYYDGYNSRNAVASKTCMINTADQSDAIKEVGYDDDKEIIYIRWTQGSLYAYYGADFNDFYGLLTADSMGKYANEEIKGIYEYKKIE